MHRVLIIADSWGDAMRRFRDAAVEVALAMRRFEKVTARALAVVAPLIVRCAPHEPHVMAVRHLKAQRWALSNRPARLPSSYG